MDFGQDHMQIKNRNYIRNCETLSRIALNAIRQLEPKFRRPGRALRVHLWVKFNSIIVQIPCPAILFAHFHLY